jgi:L-asparaginase
MTQVQKIIVLTTGGTIEKTYDEFDGSLSNRETLIKKEF